MERRESARVTDTGTTVPGAPGHRPSGAPLKVVFLLPRLEVGGAERVVLRTAAGLDARRFAASVIGLSAGRDHRFVDELRAADVPVLALGRDGQRVVPIVRLVRSLRALRCDVLVTMMFHANLIGRLVRGVGRVPILVCSERVVGWESRLRRALNRLTVPLADAVTTNSTAGRDYWARELRLRPSAIRVIPNGIDTLRFRPPATRAAGPVVIGNLSRLHPKNDHAALLEAVAILKSVPDLPAWRVVIGGDGPERQRLDDACARLGLQGTVTLDGHVAAPEGFLQTLDVYVQSSIAEGLSNSILEAMATGLPIVATAVGGTPELVGPTVGRLVPAGDSAALARAIEGLIRDETLRTVLGQQARLAVEAEFSVGHMVAVTTRLLDELTSGRRP
jgi:glycosyltransferase involved in cell wall biosynthesis